MSIFHELEHDVLPHLLFEDKGKFITTLKEHDYLIYGMVNYCFDSIGKLNPYKEEDFKIEQIKVDDTVNVLKLNFPEPVIGPLCYWVYIFYNEDYSHLKYYTVEKTSVSFGNDPFLCGWGEDGCHYNYGEIKLDEDVILKKCIKLYKDSKKDE